MKLFKKLFTFFGGLYFAITLIIATALFVLAGTLIEAATESHLYASYFTYGNPLFILLIWGFFINILLSTLRRWPFKPRHIPFIITHIGLLMILGGTLLKSYKGIQGAMSIMEGGGNDEVILSDTYALLVEWKNPDHPWKISKAMIPLHDTMQVPNTDLTVQQIGYAPHCREEYQILVDGVLQPLEKLTTLYEHDNAFGGYTVEAFIPSQAEILKEQIMISDLKSQLSLSPPLEFFRQKCDHDLFPEIAVAFLKEWDETNQWLFPNRPSHSAEGALQSLDWNALPLQIKNGCVLASRLFQHIEDGLQAGISLHEILQHLNFPLNIPKEAPLDDQLNVLLGHLFYASQLIPECTQEGIYNGRLLSAYLRLYGIHWKSVEMDEELLRREYPLQMNLIPLAPSKKMEENNPYVCLKLTEPGHTEQIRLSYDRYGMGLKWPALNGKYRMRFQPIIVKIPYRLRLRQARQINYPDSTQAFSYESDITVTSHFIEPVETTLSMNRVFETLDGYRFYLANITPTEQGLTKRVQVVVNYDPSKYWLTYPGCCLLVLGTVLLLWFRKKKEN